MSRFLFACLFPFLFASGAFAQDDPFRKIEKITGDLYMFSEGDSNGVFLVTDEGVALVDPISYDNAVWLKGELDERFGAAVKLVIYSHHHPEHISGGEVFADTATFVAHDNAKPLIEEGGYTAPPESTFSTSTGFRVGGKVVELHYIFSPHTDNLITVYFRDEKTVFLSDVFYVSEINWDEFAETSMSSTNLILSKVQETLDFEFTVPSHGRWGTRDDLEAYRLFVFGLNSLVSTAMRAGDSLEEIKQAILSKDMGFLGPFKADLPRAIEAVYQRYYDGEYFPTSKANPNYPLRAARNGICGRVVVEYDLKPDGTTENVHVMESEPTKVFDRAAIKAAEKYQYFTRSEVKGVKTQIFFEVQDACHWE